MDGVLVVDKPEGLTSHDVVAVARRALGEKRIGHTGTLDPLATGVLPLACGRATRLVRFLAASDKDYEATILFGRTTDSFDVTGEETSRTDAEPSRAAVEAAVESLRGDYLQLPPAFSAKKVGGRRAYSLARADEPVALTPVPVRVSRAEVIAFDGTRAVVALTCSAGFYVRSFAHELGIRVDVGACLEALRRTRSGDFRLSEALPFEALRDQVSAADLIPLERLLPGWPSVVVTDEGLTRVAHGRVLDPAHFRLKAEATGKVKAEATGKVKAEATGEVKAEATGESVASGFSRKDAWVRIFAPTGQLAALGQHEDTGHSLRPTIVLI
jgi:tRNA pseudouridine55 synthase